MHRQVAPADVLIARLATRQHGVVDRGQLCRIGLSDEAIGWRVARGRLHRVHRGVFAFGRAQLGPEGRWLAAVKALGSGAVLSHLSAAELWELLEADSGVVHVTVGGRGGRKRRKGIAVHRPRALDPADVTIRRGIPTTTVERTLADLARTVPPTAYRVALREAEFRGHEIGAAGGRSDGSESELERRFLRLCRRHRLPRPEVGARLGRFRVDFLWRAERLVVETDGWRAHRGRQAFEDDRERDLELRSAGFTVLRLTNRQITGRPDRVAGTLRRVLERRATP